jgi:translocator protein
MRNKMLIYTIVFLVANFGALAIGGLFTGKGVASAWYANIDKAPWTPPGWVFGAAWTTIMICFSVFCAYACLRDENKKPFLKVYFLQWILNVSWNPVFFYFHQTWLGLVVITTLLIVVGYFLFFWRRQTSNYVWLVAPYFVWLIIATSLNGYIAFKNPGA